MISRVQAASPAPVHTSRPLRQCLEYTFLSLCVSFSGVCRVAKCGARCSSRHVSLLGAVPYSSPRKGVQSALDFRIQNAPPPLMPEKATSAYVRPAALGRPRIPSLSSARTARAPRVRLALLSRTPCSFPLMTGPSSRALVTQNRWFLARPAALLLVSPRRLVSADSALVATLGLLLRAFIPRVRWFLARPAASLLVSLRRLVSAGSALVATLGPSSRALVPRNRWFLACPATLPLVSPRRLLPKRLCACSHPSVSSRIRR